MEKINKNKPKVNMKIERICLLKVLYSKTLMPFEKKKPENLKWQKQQKHTACTLFRVSLQYIDVTSSILQNLKTTTIYGKLSFILFLL